MELSHKVTKYVLVYNYCLLSLLLNSIGVVILQLVSHHVTSLNSAGWLEAFKDTSILIGAFFIASFVPNFGYKRSLLFCISLESIACLLMAAIPSFTIAHCFFILVGISFSVIKSTTYATAALVTKNEQEHSGFISILEGSFMIGTFLMFAIFGWFANQVNWQYVYWVLLLFCFIGFVLLTFMKLNESGAIKREPISLGAKFNNLSSLLCHLFMFFFITAIFCYVFIEQGINTWLPTYNHEVLYATKNLSTYLTALFPIGIAAGRLSAGFAFQKISPRTMLLFCLLGSLITLIYLEYTSALTTINHQIIAAWKQIPLSAYCIFLLGFFLGPIYPAISSRLLNMFDISQHSNITILIILFSALGGTIGSRLIAEMFAHYNGLMAFRLPMLPITLLILLTIPLYNIDKNDSENILFTCEMTEEPEQL